VTVAVTHGHTKIGLKGQPPILDGKLLKKVCIREGERQRETGERRGRKRDRDRGSGSDTRAH
jgi:hypothetical protein